MAYGGVSDGSDGASGLDTLDKPGSADRPRAALLTRLLLPLASLFEAPQRYASVSLAFCICTAVYSQSASRAVAAPLSAAVA